MTVEVLAHSHLVEWGYPVVPDEMVGFAMRGDDGKLCALAAVCYVAKPADPKLPGGWWANFDSKGPVSPLAHRYAIKVRDALRDAGVRVIYAIADPDIPTAPKWLSRLGLSPWHEDVWRIELVVDAGSRRTAGLG